MRCCCLGLSLPRIAIVALVVFSDWLGNAYETTWVPFLGFLFAPLTTIAYAFVMHEHGTLEGVWYAPVVVAALVDLGILGGSAKSKSRPSKPKGDES